MESTSTNHNDMPIERILGAELITEPRNEEIDQNVGVPSQLMLVAIICSHGSWLITIMSLTSY